MEKMENLSLEEGDMDRNSVASSSRSVSVSSGSVNLEEGTAIRISGFSKGFLAGRFLDRDQVPCIAVTGTQIKGHIGLTTYVAKHLQTYYVRRVLSPFEFYLERESDIKGDQERLRHEKMQDYYQRQDEGAFVYSIQVSKMKCYAYYDGNSQSWWRVRVQDFDFQEGINRAYIYYCDTGRQEYILCESLRKLESDFQGAWDSAMLKCYLFDILPRSGGLNWSIDAIAYFKEIISNQRLGAIVMKWSKRLVVEHSPDFTTDCGVVLIEKLDPAERPDTINWLMVKMGYARCIGIMSSSPTALDIKGSIPYFSIPKCTDMPKAREAEDTGTGISFEELHRIATRAMSYSGPEQYIPVYCERPSESKNNPENYVPFSIRCRLPWMRMSFVEGPGKMFIHARNKKLELKAMEAEMQETCMAMGKLSSVSLRPGSTITCHMKDPNTESEDCWCRAVVLKVDHSKQAAKLLLVDYGNIMMIHISILYPMPDKYRSIPSFVHRVHLSDIRPNYNFPTWDDSINKAFLKYIVSHEVDTPLYYVHVPDIADIVKFTEISQGLFFNDVAEKWVADYPSKTPNEDEDQTINSMRDDPLLASYFCSRPVGIFYELAVKQVQFWEFASLSDYLVKREYANLVTPKVDKNKIHKILENGFGTL